MLDYNPVAKCIIGERYEAHVPDTLDLADRMGLSINALTNVWYPEEKWAMAFTADFAHRPPVMHHSHPTDAFLNIPPKFLEALILCRLASGSRENIDIDANVLDAQLGFLGEDGLGYCPADALPDLGDMRDYSEVWAEGRMLTFLSMLCQVNDDPRWVALGKKKVDRLLSFTRRREDFLF